MLLQLKPLFLGETETLPIEVEVDLSSLEWDGIHPFPHPVRVAGEARAFSGMVTLRATAFFRYEGACASCAAPLSREMEAPMEHILVTSLNHEDNDEFLLVENYQLSLDELTEADVILSLPSKILCREDCRGLCPHCGKDLNEGLCGCRSAEPEDPVDARLAALKQLLD